MKLIKGGLFRTVCTYIFENAWTCMWLLCDEVPTNCERFLNENGMKYFLGYLAVRSQIMKIFFFFVYFSNFFYF